MSFERYLMRAKKSICMECTTMNKRADRKKELSPITASLAGILRGSKMTKEDYKRHLLEKHGESGDSVILPEKFRN